MNANQMKVQTKAIFTALLLITLVLFGKQVHAKPPAANTSDKILFIVSSDQHGFWLPEVLEPYQILSNKGFSIDIASPEGGAGTPRGQFQLSSKQRKWLKSSELKHSLNQTLPLSQIDSDNYQAVYFAGGAGPMFDFPNNHLVQQITRDIYEAGGIVSADCHGPAALLNVTLSDGTLLVKGKKITAKANHEEGRWARNNYPFLLESKFKTIGAHYSSKAKGKPHVVVDQRVITGQNPASAIPMAEKLAEILMNQD